jgi:alanine racemase
LQTDSNDKIEPVKSWLEISEERLSANYRLLARAAGADTAVLAVIKANAYGHGAALCASILAQAGAPWLGVTDAAEAETVLNALAATKHRPNILIMSGPLPEDADAIVRHGYTPVLWHRRQMEWLLAAAQRLGATVHLHLEIDTGMSRQGIAPGDELDALLHWLKAQPLLHLDGVFTHFASAEVEGSPQTLAQRSRFEQAIAAVAHANLRPTWVHAGNSSTVDTEPTEQTLAWLRKLASTVNARSMVRTGIALYGYCLPIATTSAALPTSQPTVQPELRPVLTWKTRIIGLRDIHPGDTVGYNAIFSAQHPMRLALLPIGYADGLRRELSGSNTQPGGWVIIHGHRAPIVGRISMNLTTIDITAIPEVNLGDEATVLGDHITADDHARLARTIPYEILCGLHVLPDGPPARRAVTS